MLDFPSDIVDIIARGDINLFETEQLARLTPQRLGVPPQKRVVYGPTYLAATCRRGGPVRVCMRGSKSCSGSPAQPCLQPTGIQRPLAARIELEDFDPHDPTHLFYDEIKRLGFALKEITPADLTDDLLDEYLRASEPLWSVLAKIQKRKQPVRPVKLKI